MSRTAFSRLIAAYIIGVRSFCWLGTISHSVGAHAEALNPLKDDSSSRSSLGKEDSQVPLQ